MKHLLLLTLCVSIITGCSSKDVSQYIDNSPKFDLYSYFSGETKGYGIVQDRKGNLTRQFVVDIVGTVNTNNELVLDEKFVWNDGEKTQRIWTISREDVHKYSGSASDVVGNATGISYGNVLNWNYVLNLEVDDSVWKIRFDDWMFLQPDGVLLNKASMTKFGLHVGEVTIVFNKLER